MATITLYLDSRRANNDGTYNIRLCLRQHKSTIMRSTGISINANEWDAKNCRAIGRANIPINVELETMLYEWRQALKNIGRIEHLTAKQIAERIEKALDPSAKNIGSFATAFATYVNKVTGRTRQLYEGTWHRVTQFCDDADMLALEDITHKWLDAFDAYLSITSPSPNARSIHFRNIRAVFNLAIDDELTTFYPFRKFKIKTTETAKRSLSVEDLRFIFHYEAEEHAQKYIDIFKVIFLLIGINIADLFKLRQLRNGRAEYTRAKTKKLYSIKAEPEALELLKQFTGDDDVINIAPTYSNCRDFAKKINKALQQIGEVNRVGLGGKKVYKPIFPNLTTYWARHSWATIAAELDIPNETIAAALGHSYGNRTTAIYIDFNRKKVDEANRRVIDYVLYGKR